MSTTVNLNIHHVDRVRVSGPHATGVYILRVEGFDPVEITLFPASGLTSIPFDFTPDR